MADEMNPASESAGTDVDLKSQIKAILAEIKAEEDAAIVGNLADPAPTPAAADPAEDPATKAMDALRAELASLKKQLSVAQDSGSLLGQIADRDALYAKVSPFIGAFDHASMTADALAAYAVKKLEVPAKAGTERVALDAWLHGRTPDLNKPTFAADSGGKVVSLNQLWKESK